MKTMLKVYLDTYPELEEVLMDLLRITEDNANIRGIMEFSGIDRNKVYLATPMQRNDRIREVLPEISQYFWVYDYSKSHFGEYLDVGEMFTKALFEKLSDIIFEISAGKAAKKLLNQKFDKK